MKKEARVETYKDADGDTRMKVVAANGNILVATTEGYKRPIDAKKAMKSAAIAIVKALFCVALAFAPAKAQAQTNELFSGPGRVAFDFLTTGSNWMVSPYAIYDAGSKRFGAGLAAVSTFSDYASAMLRLDVLDIGKGNTVWMPSGNIQLQAPVKVMGKFDLIPFAFTGVATALSGRGDSNGDLVGMFGVGGAVRIGSKWDILFDVEKWTGFDGLQYRAGFGYKF